MNTNKKILLAFSGGLDTTYCAIFLSKVLGYEVHTVTINTGGFNEKELREIESKAYTLGVKSHKNIDALVPFYDNCIKYLIAGNVLRNHTYPLSVSAERAFQALSIAEYAKELKVDAIAHGSTGAGNDQVRFDLCFHIYCPEMEIITPIRDQKISREDEIKFLAQHGVNITAKKYQYSINKGVWGTSVGGVETLTSNKTLPDSAYPSQLVASGTINCTLTFKNGDLIAIDDESFDHPIFAISKLEKIASKFCIGRDIHIGDTIIGIKGRVGFEAAAAMITLKSHQTLEKHVLTKYQISTKDQMAMQYGNMVHEAMFLEPVMRDIEQFFISTQKRVSGKVFISLYPYRFKIDGIESQFDLMSAKDGVYGEMNNSWNGDDVKGFTKILANQQKIYFGLESVQK